jgi:hypothetical protein
MKSMKRMVAAAGVAAALGATPLLTRAETRDPGVHERVSACACCEAAQQGSRGDAAGEESDARRAFLEQIWTAP